MATEKTLEGQPYAGHNHLEVASALTPRRGVLLYKGLVTLMLSMGCLSVGFAWGRQISVDLRASQPVTRVQTCIDDTHTAKDSHSEDDDEAVELGEAFGFNWRTGKSHPWTIYKDNDFMASWDFRRFDESGNALSPNQGASWMETTTVGPTRMAFLYYTYMAFGPFTISLDGNVIVHEGDSTYKKWRDIEVPPGEHVVRITFVANDWFCGYAVENGAHLYDVRKYSLEYRPVITPASTGDEDTATTFWGSCEVAITNMVPDSKIYYTLDDKWPVTNRQISVSWADHLVFGVGEDEKAVEDCILYTGPFTITNSTIIKAVSVQPDGTLTMPDVSLLLKRHEIGPGEWTPDADGALKASQKDGNMVIARWTRSYSLGGLPSCYSSEHMEKYVAVTESRDFLDWAKAHGVYLIECDDPMVANTRPIHLEWEAAYSYYASLAQESYGDAIVFAHAWSPYNVVGTADLTEGNKIGDVAYDGTAASLIAILEQYFEERPANKYVNVRFRLEDGEMADTNRVYKSGEPFGTLPTPKYSGDDFRGNCYRFRGWYAYNNGEWARAADHVCGYGTITIESEDRVPYSDVELIGQWEYAGVSVVFMDGEYPSWNYYVPGEAYGELPADPWRDGHTFTGWYTDPVGGERVTADSILPITATDLSVTNYAHWTANGGGSGNDPGTGGGSTGGSEGTGGDATGGGDVVGDRIAGRLETGFAKAQTVLGTLYGGDGVPVGTVQVKIGKVNKKKGTVKISATATLLVDGKAKKVKANAVNVEVAAANGADAQERVHPKVIPFKAPIGEMAFEMAADGTFTLKNGSYVMAEKSVGGNWTRTGAKVRVDVGGASDPAAAGTAAPHTALPAGTIEELLPDGEPVIPKAGKWSFAKATGVKYAKDKKTKVASLVIDTKKGTNRSAMKLTYTPKTGIFKGSFKIYAIQDGKLKKFTVKVIGLVVDGKGWGSATGPGGVSFAVTVE